MDKLEKYRPKLNLWINDQTCHLNIDEKAEILNVIREEFNPGYHVDMWCGSCVVRMMEYAFREMDKRKVETITIPLSDSFTIINTPEWSKMDNPLPPPQTKKK